MSKKKKVLTDLTDARSVQNLARPYRLPDCLVTKEAAKLIPLFLYIESLSIKKGYCFAGDQRLADDLGYNKSSVVRQRLKLERFGVVIREGEAKNRKLWPWWQWVAANAGKSLNEVEALLERLMPPPPGQAELFKDDDFITPTRVETVPEPAHLKEAIMAKYGALSYFELAEQQQVSLRVTWRLETFADLCFLFNQVLITPEGYGNYRKLTPAQRQQIENHAPHYAYGNRDNQAFMADLADYLNPYKPGYLKRLRDIASQKLNQQRAAAAGASSSTGFNKEQATFLAGQMSKTIKLR